MTALLACPLADFDRGLAYRELLMELQDRWCRRLRCQLLEVGAPDKDLENIEAKLEGLRCAVEEDAAANLFGRAEVHPLETMAKIEAYVERWGEPDESVGPVVGAMRNIARRVKR